MSRTAAGLPDDLRLVFTVTTGRSGTEYLARVLGLFRGVRAAHEPKPTFASAFRTVCAAPQTAREFWLQHKLPRIARVRAAVYAETSHLACKGFLESLIELDLQPTLIHLRREPHAVARSMLALGTVPGRTYKGVKYYVGPGDRVFLPLDPPAAARLSDYQMCLWYCLEIEARARAYAERFAPLGMKLLRVELDDIQTPEGVLALGERLDLPGLSARGRLMLSSIAGRPVNSKADKKSSLESTGAELAAQESELRRLLGWRTAQSSSR